MSISSKDNTLRGAKNLRELSSTKSVAGFVGKQDKLDVYKFTLGRSSKISLSLSKMNANADVALLNGRGSLIASSSQLKNLPESIATALESGTYYLRIKCRGNGNTRYTLRISTSSSASQPTSSAPYNSPVPSNFGEPGSTLDTAFGTGTLVGKQIHQGSIGDSDKTDLYKFTLDQNSDLYASLDGLSISADVNLIFDANNNGFIDGNERIATGYGGSSGSTPISKTLPKGTYFIEVRTFSSSNSLYNLTLSATAQPGSVSRDPGSSLSTAYSLGQLPDQLVTTDLVGSLDKSDYYKFKLDHNSQFNATLSRVFSSVDINLIFDANNNGFLDGTEQIASGYGSTFDNTPISEVLPMGTYFMEVKSFSSYANTIYDLALSAKKLASNVAYDPGDNLNETYKLGSLSDELVAKDLVGALDKTDCYGFTLEKDGDFSAALSGLSGSADISLIRDINSNGLIDGNERIASGYGSTSSNSPISRVLQAGMYFIEVRSYSSSDNTAYTLTLAD